MGVQYEMPRGFFYRFSFRFCKHRIGKIQAIVLADTGAAAIGKAIIPNLVPGQRKIGVSFFVGAGDAGSVDQKIEGRFPVSR